MYLFLEWGTCLQPSVRHCRTPPCTILSVHSLVALSIVNPVLVYLTQYAHTLYKQLRFVYATTGAMYLSLGPGKTQHPFTKVPLWLLPKVTRMVYLRRLWPKKETRPPKQYIKQYHCWVFLLFHAKRVKINFRFWAMQGCSAHWLGGDFLCAPIPAPFPQSTKPAQDHSSCFDCKSEQFEWH